MVSDMPNMTLSIPAELFKLMKKYSEIRWSEIARRAIARRIEELETLDRLLSKSKLTKADVTDLDKLIKSSMWKRIQRNQRKKKK